MGLLDMLMPGVGSNPFYQAFDQNRGKITGAFGGMVGAGNDPRQALMGFTGGLQHGVGVDQENAIIRQKQAEDAAKIEQQKQQQNMTIAMLQEQAAKDPRYVPLLQGVQSGVLPVGDAFNKHIEYQNGGSMAGNDAPATVQEWEYFSKLNPEQQAAYLRMKRSTPYLNLGDEYAQPDPAQPGKISGPTIKIDNFSPAYDAAVGTGTGKIDVENQAAFDSLNSKLPGLQSVVAELGTLAKKATYTATGQLIDNAMREAGMEPSEAAVARAQYIATIDNQILPLLRDTFGAAFTAKEGETLRATLGDPNKSPAEKQVVLEAFIAQKLRDLEALRSRLPGIAPTLAPGPRVGIAPLSDPAADALVDKWLQQGAQ